MRRIRIVTGALLAVLVTVINSTNVYASDTRNPMRCCTVVMVGDDLIHSPLYKIAAQSDGSYDFSKQFDKISEIRDADIAIINQETILVDDYSKVSSYPCFGTPCEIGDDIVNAGFDIVCHATNHTYDKGYSGIESTINYWRINYPNIPVLGIHSDINEKDYYLYEYNDLIIGFVNYTYGLNGITRTKEYSVDLLSDSDIEDTILECCTRSDIQIAILHVGEEYRYTPTAYQKEQVEKFIDYGADVVICNHPHVVEPYEYMTTANGNKGLVYYSLGNFISGQTKIDRCLGGMAKINIIYDTDDNGNVTMTSVAEYDMIPLFTHQQRGNYTTYKLSDYTDDLLKNHKLYGKTNGSSVDSIWKLWESIIEK